MRGQGLLIEAIESDPRSSQQEDIVPLIPRSDLCLRRTLRAEDAVEAFAVLKEDQHP
jgi:hypothetical protein